MYVIVVRVHKNFSSSTDGTVLFHPLDGATVPDVEYAYSTVVDFIPTPVLPVKSTGDVSVVAPLPNVRVVFTQINSPGFRVGGDVTHPEVGATVSEVLMAQKSCVLTIEASLIAWEAAAAS